MKKATKTKGKRSYRLITGTTFLAVVISALCGALGSFDACLSAVLGGITVITLGSILSLTVESAAEIRRAENEAEEISSVSRKMAKRS